MGFQRETTFLCFWRALDRAMTFDGFEPASFEEARLAWADLGETGKRAYARLRGRA